MQVQDCQRNTENSSLRAVRGSLERLHALDPKRAQLLDGLAFILMRVAEADNVVDIVETHCMESILTEHAHLPTDQAILVTEIARHRLHIADAGAAYEVSRNLRNDLDPQIRGQLFDFLEKVALADGTVCSGEQAAIQQIAWELGIGRPAPATNA